MPEPPPTDCRAFAIAVDELRARYGTKRPRAPTDGDRMMTNETKVCIDCARELPLDDFYALRSAEPERRQSRCKVCDNQKRTKRLGGPVRARVAGATGPMEADANANRGRVDVERREDGSLVMVRR